MKWRHLPRHRLPTVSKGIQSDCTRIDILRHGEHVLGDAICGVTDPELSEEGWQQLKRQTSRLKNTDSDWNLCVSSPRRRCVSFARDFSERHRIDCIVDDDFAEVDFGEWETLSFVQILSRYPGQWNAWIGQPDQPAPHGGEVYADFLCRVHNAFTRLIETHRGKRIVLFAHGGVIRAIFHSMLDLETDALHRFNIPYACHSRIIVYHGDNQENWFQLDSHNTR